MIAFIFAGQGSQRPGMGRDLFDKYPDWVAIADSVLGYSVVRICLEDYALLNQTKYAQPAIFTVTAMMMRRYMERTGVRPDILAGHSLGELNALLAADVFDFEGGLRIVKARAELMYDFGSDGGMAALIGERPALLDVIRKGGTDLHLAIDNSPRQMVVAGKPEALANCERHLRESGTGTCVLLAVSGPFHSPWMASARDRFLGFLEEQSLAPPRISVLANVNAAPYRPDRIRETMANQLVSPVCWTQIVTRLLKANAILFQEFGPRRVLTPMVQEVMQHHPLHHPG